jgi:hypothetical protein
VLPNLSLSHYNIPHFLGVTVPIYNILSLKEVAQSAGTTPHKTEVTSSNPHSPLLCGHVKKYIYSLSQITSTKHFVIVHLYCLKLFIEFFYHLSLSFVALFMVLMGSILNRESSNEKQIHIWKVIWLMIPYLISSIYIPFFLIDENSQLWNFFMKIDVMMTVN